MVKIASGVLSPLWLLGPSVWLLALATPARAEDAPRGPSASAKPGTSIKVTAAADRAVISFLSWDTEGGDRSERNLLRPGTGVLLKLRIDGAWRQGVELETRCEELAGAGRRYSLSLGAGSELLWDVCPSRDRLELRLALKGAGPRGLEGLELVLPFDPTVTPTTALPSEWGEDGSFKLPAVVSAPDFGQMLLGASGGLRPKARLLGSRAKKTVDFLVELPVPTAGGEIKLSLEPVLLAPPSGLEDLEMWRAARRGWFSAFQPSSEWGEQGRPFSAPAGILGNNVISDPASCSLWFYADQALWTPEAAPGVSVAALVRRAIDWWLEKRTRPSGEVVCYWDFGNFLDANAGPLIAAWDYVESTGDLEWLAGRIERLEFIADFLGRRDIDGDGLVEATQSGNRGTLLQPGRSCAWWDALNCGHKDGYTNAVIYRAWRCLADLEAKLKRKEPEARFTTLADRLKKSYRDALYNPKTGWLGWWRSQDGELHDYSSPTLNGLAVEYGLVEPAEGREILARLWKKMADAGFQRLDLGVPPMLVPVPRGDYLLPDSVGCPRREDGTDTFGQYMNGGITAGHVLHFLAAHYVVGEPEKADKLLRAMLERQGRGEFQNGVTDQAGKGIDWTTWDGKPCGYEGYLADSFRFLQAVLLREPSFRTRYYRPLFPRQDGGKPGKQP
jgi:hypothetical protein